MGHYRGTSRKSFIGKRSATIEEIALFLTFSLRYGHIACIVMKTKIKIIKKSESK